MAIGKPIEYKAIADIENNVMLSIEAKSTPIIDKMLESAPRGKEMYVINQSHFVPMGA